MIVDKACSDPDVVLVAVVTHNLVNIHTSPLFHLGFTRVAEDS